MSDVTSKHCDGPGCSNVKRDANHWYRAFEGHYQIIFAVWSGSSSDPIEFDSLVGTMLDLCGEECAGKRLAAFMQRSQATGEASPAVQSSGSGQGVTP